MIQKEVKIKGDRQNCLRKSDWKNREWKRSKKEKKKYRDRKIENEEKSEREKKIIVSSRAVKNRNQCVILKSWPLT